jgi:hypothetical protein
MSNEGVFLRLSYWIEWSEWLLVVAASSAMLDGLVDRELQGRMLQDTLVFPNFVIHS